MSVPNMQRTFSARFMRERGEAGIEAWKNDVAAALRISLRESRRIASAHGNVTVFLEPAP